MNHSLPGVNAGYITRDKLLRDHLRKQQERVSAIVTERARDRDGRPCLSWLAQRRWIRRSQKNSNRQRRSAGTTESPRSPRGWRSLRMSDKPLLSRGLPISSLPKVAIITQCEFRNGEWPGALLRWDGPGLALLQTRGSSWGFSGYSITLLRQNAAGNGLENQIVEAEYQKPARKVLMGLADDGGLRFDAYVQGFCRRNWPQGSRRS